MADPLTVYNGMINQMRLLCKTNQQVMDATILQYQFHDEQANIFRHLIVNDGQYINKYPQNIQANKLQQRHDKKINGILQSIDDKENEKDSSLKNLHHKLRGLSCFINPTNGTINRNRRLIGNMLNENINLDSISQSKVYSIVSSLAKIKTEYETVIGIMELQFVKSLKDLNIKTHIETVQGTYKISDEIDKLCSRFLRWDNKYNQCLSECDNQIKCINNTIISLGLGFYSSERKRFIPTLTQQKYDIKIKQIVTENKGHELFDCCIEIKRNFIKFKKELSTLNESIQSKRNNKIYTKYIHKIKGGKIIANIEEQRAAKYAKTNKKKKDKKDKKKNKKKKKNNDKKNKDNDKTTKCKENQKNKINNYFIVGDSNSRKRKEAEDRINDSPLKKKRKFSFVSNVNL